MVVPWFAGAVTALPLLLGAGSLVEKGYETCGAITGKLAVMLPNANPICQPGNDDGKIAIVVVSPVPILQSADAKPGWFIATVTAVGMEARAAGIQDFTTLFVTDFELMRTLDTYTIPVARAAVLQQQIHDDRITGKAYLDAVMHEMVPTKLPNRLISKESR